MMTRILLSLLCVSLLSIGTGCYFDPSPYNPHPYYRGEGRSDQEQRRSDDDQERQHSRRDRNQDSRGDESRTGQYDHGDQSGQDRYGR
jgi:hypothetical protein